MKYYRTIAHCVDYTVVCAAPLIEKVLVCNAKNESDQSISTAGPYIGKNVYFITVSRQIGCDAHTRACTRNSSATSKAGAKNAAGRGTGFK